MSPGIHSFPKSELAEIDRRRSVKLSKHTKLVVISYDGFRFDYTTKTSTPNLDALKANGVTTAYQIPQFPTSTFSNHQSLVTGLYTQIHGVTARTVWDPVHRRRLSGIKNDEEYWKFHEDVVPLWILNEWAGDGRTSGAQFPRSVHDYGLNRTTPTHSLEFNLFRSFEARMDYVVSWLTNETSPANLVFMHFDEPDEQGHRHGPNSKQVIAVIKKLDYITGYFVKTLKKLNILDEVNLIFWSDHGMEEVQLRNVIYFVPIVDTALYDWDLDNTVLEIWPKEDRMTGIIYEQFIVGSRNKNFTVYKKSDLPERWKFSNNRRVAPIVLVSDTGYIFNKSKSSKKLKRGGVVGIHGYDVLNPNMRPFFIAHGPAFQKGLEISPFENVDLFPLICHLMGFEAPPNNGTLSRVQAALVQKISGGEQLSALENSQGKPKRYLGFLEVVLKKVEYARINSELVLSLITGFTPDPASIQNVVHIAT